jgi:hypothetical protein
MLGPQASSPARSPRRTLGHTAGEDACGPSITSLESWEGVTKGIESVMAGEVRCVVRLRTSLLWQELLSSHLETEIHCITKL